MKKLVAIILVLCAVVVFCAAQAEVQYPFEITDHAGRTVVIEEQPQRLVSGYYISTSALIALGLADKVVGVEAKAEKRPIYKLSAPDFLELPNVGTAKEFDMEGCLALEPDLVILPLKLKSAVETLEQMSIPVLLVNPENQELLLESIDMIATATNTQERAGEIKDFIMEQEQLLSGITGEKPSVYLGGNSSLLSTAGEAMYQSHMIEAAGAENVAGEITDAYWAEISYEQLLTWNPEYIVLASDAGYSVEEVLADPNLAECTAILNGNVLKIPGDIEAWDSPVPSGILGSLWLASVLHPDEVSAEYSDTVINDFYHSFYGIDISEK